MLSAAKHLVGWRDQHPDPMLIAAAVVGSLGVSVVVLSFLPWIAHGYPPWDMVSVDGNDMEGFTDVGDGWVTATAGGIATLLGMSVMLAILRGQLIASAIATCGLVTASIAGYDLANGWEEPRYSVISGLPQFEVTREPALWATGAAGLLITAAGAALLIAANRRHPPADDAAEHQETQAWG